MKRGGIVVIAVAYAWWATAVRPFTPLAYILVAVPSLLALVLHVRRAVPRRRDVEAAVTTPGKSVTPWLVLCGCAVALEIIGLTLGGRSTNVPTLSTTLDHLLVEHWSRACVFLVWMSVAFARRRFERPRVVGA